MSTVIYAAHIFSQEAQDNTPVGAAFTVSAGLVAFVLSYLIPLGTALVTRLTAHPFLKYIVTAVLAAVASVANAAVTNSGVAIVSWNTVLLAVGTFVLSIVQYKAVLQPAFHIDERIAPNAGLGGRAVAA